jgi:uncharacterized protein YggE
MHHYTLTAGMLWFSATVAAAAGPAGHALPKANLIAPGAVLANLEVTGSASVKSLPDRVVIGATITSRDRKASRAFEDNQARMATALGRLEAAGLAKQRVATESLSVSPVYRSDNKIEQFVVTRRLRITQDDLGNVSPILDGLVDSGVEEIQSIQFLVKDAEGQYDEALRRAVTDCRTKAEVLASGLGARIVGIQAVSYDQGDAFAARHLAIAEQERAVAGAGTQMIVPSEVSATVHVRVVYTLEYGGD